MESVKWLLKRGVDTTLRNVSHVQNTLANFRTNTCTPTLTRTLALQDRNKTAMDLATQEIKEIFEAHFAGRSTPSNKKPANEVALEGLPDTLFSPPPFLTLVLPSFFTLSLEDYGIKANRERREQLGQILKQDPSAEIPADLFGSWPLHEGLKATQLLRKSRFDALELKRQAFNAKLKMLKQSQSNLAVLRERRTGISRVIQDLQAQLSAAEKQLNVIEVEEFRAQRETDELKAEYANESDQLGKLQRAKDRILQITTPVVNNWHEWISWSDQQPLSEFTATDVITLLAQMDVAFDVDAAIRLNLDGKALLAATPTLLKDQLKVAALGDRLRVQTLQEKARKQPSLDLLKDPLFNITEVDKGPSAQPRDWHFLLPQEWVLAEVAEWVAETPGLEEVAATLLEQKVDGRQLVGLTEADLMDQLKITSSEHRRLLLGAMANILAGVAKRKAVVDAAEAAPKRAKVGEAPTVTPREFICSLTHKMMVDPVLATDGHTYERAAIERWLSESVLSPTTKQPIPSKVVFPNHSLKSLIDEYLQKKGH